MAISIWQPVLYPVDQIQGIFGGSLVGPSPLSLSPSSSRNNNQFFSPRPRTKVLWIRDKGLLNGRGRHPTRQPVGMMINDGSFWCFSGLVNLYTLTSPRWTMPKNHNNLSWHSQSASQLANHVATKPFKPFHSMNKYEYFWSIVMSATTMNGTHWTFNQPSQNSESHQKVNIPDSFSSFGQRIDDHLFRVFTWFFFDHRVFVNAVPTIEREQKWLDTWWTKCLFSIQALTVRWLGTETTGVKTIHNNFESSSHHIIKSRFWAIVCFVSLRANVFIQFLLP